MAKLDRPGQATTCGDIHRVHEGGSWECDLAPGHDGGHEDHSQMNATGAIWCWLSEDQVKQATDWLTTVRKFGLERANELFPNN